MLATVTMFYKPSILDDEGRAICSSLNSLGHKTVQDVRVSKQLKIQLNETCKDKAKKSIDKMCKQMLVNEVMQDYTITIQEPQTTKSN